MKKSTINRAFVALFSLAMSVCLINCSGSGDSAGNSENETVASDNYNKMMKQLDKAISDCNFDFAFKVLNSIPSHFNEYSKFYYNSWTGKIGEGRSEYDHNQYCRKAVSVLKAESDVLLTKDDPEAENLFLEHLADFDLGVNNVNIGMFDYASKENRVNENYQEAVTIFNDYLISVIRKTLVKNKPELAKKISLQIRDGLSFTPGESSIYYIWAYDTEAKDEAQEIIAKYNPSCPR